MPALSIYGYPAAWTALTIVEEKIGMACRGKKASLLKHVRNAAGAIIRGIVMLAVTTAPSIRLAYDAVRGGNCSFHLGWRIRRSNSASVLQHCRFSWDVVVAGDLIRGLLLLLSDA